MIEKLIYIAAGLLTVIIPLVYIMRERRKSRIASETLNKAISDGLDEPVSLHPVIDPEICIGSAACVPACPEGTIIGLINNRGQLIRPSKCIGHGECEASCPVGAITLVFGTEKRGVDIPHVNGNFESNVPGIFIAGELGGMGLIRNAVNQGSQAARNIARRLKSNDNNSILDLVVIGAGPAGISASLQAMQDGLNFLAIDQDELGGTILTYPRRKLVMTSPMELPIHGRINKREIEKEELLDILGNVTSKTGLKINSRERVEDIERLEKGFRVKTIKGEYEALNVILAIGRRGSPRKLGVPGEVSDKVSYRLPEPEKFAGLRILVVGGGDAAIEAAVALAEQKGCTVSISYRRENFFRIKEDNRSRIERAITSEQVVPLFNSKVKEIKKESVRLLQNNDEIELDNDYVFIFAGGELPREFLSRAGIEFSRKFGEA